MKILEMRFPNGPDKDWKTCPQKFPDATSSEDIMGFASAVARAMNPKGHPDLEVEFRIVEGMLN